MIKSTFFNLDDELKILGVDIDQGAGCYAFITPRNTGKTSSTLKSILERCLGTQRSFCLVRTSRAELEAAQKLLNLLRPERIRATQTHVWAGHLEVAEDGTERFIKERVIGFLANLTSASAFKSAFENDGENIDIRYVIYDEFNEVKVRDNLYEEFVNLLTTIKRNNPNFSVVMLGNKDNANNPFLVDWGIRFKEELKEKMVLDLRDQFGVLYVEYPMGHFAGTNLADNFISKLASANEEMDRFINKGGFRKTSFDQIVKYDTWIRPNIRKKLYNLIIRKQCYEVGLFDDTFLERENCLYFRSVDLGDRDTEITTFAFAAQGALTKGVGELDVDDIVDLVDFFSGYAYNGKIYFTTFRGFYDIIQEIYITKRYLAGND